MKVRTLGLVMDRSLPAYQRALLEGVLAAARAGGVNLRVFLGGKISEGRAGRGYSAIYRFARAPAVEGLVVAASSIADADATRLFTQFVKDRGVPLCSVGLPEGGTTHVGVDADTGIEALCEHLVTDHGYRRFAMITGPAYNVESRAREATWRSALERRGLGLSESHVSHQSFRWRRGVDGVRQLLDERGLSPRDIDVLVCLNDGLGVGALEELRARRIDVPGDLAVVGFDDIAEARHAAPPLTTLRQPVVEMAKLATEKVLGMMSGRAVESELLRSDVVRRRSCGCGGPITQAHLPAAQALDLDERFEAVLGDSGLGFPEGVPAKLFDSLSIAASEAAFAREIEDLCARWVDERLPLDSVEALLDGLVGSVREFCADPVRRLQLESRLHDARTVLSHAVERRETRRRVVSAESLYHLNEVTLSLIGDGNRSVYRLLREHFPTLGVRECHLSLYRDESLEHATYVLGHTEEGPVELPPGQRGFASRELVPKGVLSPFVRFEHVVVPLVHQDRQLGFALLKLGEPEVVHYEALREALAFVLGTLD